MGQTKHESNSVEVGVGSHEVFLPFSLASLKSPTAKENREFPKYRFRNLSIVTQGIFYCRLTP